MRAKIVAGNWKMNKRLEEAEALVFGICQSLKDATIDDAYQLIICPPALYLNTVQDVISEEDRSQIFVGAQNCHEKDAGAFTGEIAAPMLTDLGISHVIIGHSERRSYYGETDELLKAKVENALRNDLSVIFCCGEQLSVREENGHFDLVEKQVRTALFHLSPEQLSNVIIAYEPVWAIGTGVVASPEQAEEMHAHIRQLLTTQFDATLAANTTILYGGSCKPANAEAIFSKPNVDGGLIGGASLKADAFVELYKILREVA